MKVLVVAHFTFREAVRKKVVLGTALLSLGFLGIYALGAHLSYADYAGYAARATPGTGTVVSNSLMLAGLYVVNFMAGLLAIFAAVGTVSSEIDSGTLHAIVPKPIGRREIVLGKWLGLAAMLVAYTVAMGAAVMGIIYFVWGAPPPQPFTGLALMSLCTLLLLSLAVLGSTFLSTVANGIVVFMLYGVGLMGGLIEQIGALVRNETMVNVGIATSLLIPSDVLWKMAAYSMQTQDLLARAITTPFWGASPPSPAMVVYAALYATVAVVIATEVFSHRDL